MNYRCVWARSTALSISFLAFGLSAFPQHDPGPDPGSGRKTNGSPATGDPLAGLTSGETAAFNNGRITFQEVDSVSGSLDPGLGLGPRFNLDSCSGCHSFPAVGGSAPAVNPQVAVATKAGARNTVPSFITLDGPIREARFVRTPSGTADGGVRGLFVISGRKDAADCQIAQPNFAAELAANNLAFRIPTPLFGAGLIEAIDDKTILANRDANASQKAALGILGHENRNANDGSLTRFGWKAQNKSLFIFAGEAYNVEQGVTNDLFPNERESAAGCVYNASPEDHIDVNGGTRGRPTTTPSDLIDFVFFMRFLAAPARGATSGSSDSGELLFSSIGCALCHTPSLKTSSYQTTALSNVAVNLYSDLILHDMGTGLEDGITQGFATGREFRTAPLWGLGQRLFFLHDGRTKDLTAAIAAHSSNGSEANKVVANYNKLSAQQKQDLLQFLRSL